MLYIVSLYTLSKVFIIQNGNAHKDCPEVLLPLPVGFPQKLQGSSRHTEVSWTTYLLVSHTSADRNTAPLLTLLYLQLCCPFI